MHTEVTNSKCYVCFCFFRAFSPIFYFNL